MRLDRPTLPWVIPDLLPAGLTVLFGRPKEAGKTTLALQVAYAVARGEPFLGRPCRQGPVLYLQLDTGEHVWRERLRRLQAGGFRLDGPVYTAHPDEIPMPRDIRQPRTREWIGGLLAEVKPALTIVDSFRELHSADEDKSTEMKAVADAWEPLFAGRAVLLIHHMTKPPKEGLHTTGAIIDAIRGSGYIAGKLDSIWFVHDGRLRVIDRLNPFFEARDSRDALGLHQLRQLREQSA